MLEKIQKKCDDNGLATKLSKTKVHVGKGKESERTVLLIEIPCGRESKNIILSKKNDDVLRKILKSNFYNYKYIKGFEGIYSLDEKVIECEIQTDDLFRSSNFIIKRLADFFPADNVLIEEESDELDESKARISSFEFPSPKDGIRILIGESSDEFSILSGFKRESYFLKNRFRNFLTIRIEGADFETHDEAKQLLQKLGNSIFFQIDLSTNFPLHLSLDRDIKNEMRVRRRSIKNDFKFTPPKFRYDQEPISLYWYARTARNIPLLQFLAFYQVLEFYFPLYSSMEAQQRIKHLLKDPSFDRNEEKNISKILEIAKSSSRGNTYGNERDQIKATILHCVDETELIDFLDESEERRDFFDSQKKSKSLVKHKIAYKRSDHDIRNDVSTRIYDLRCRIVHTKEEDNAELLLPFSEDVKYLKHDLELIEFISRKVLIASSKTLKV